MKERQNADKISICESKETTDINYDDAAVLYMVGKLLIKWQFCRNTQ